MWPFSKPQPKLPPINEDWAVGDLAECVVGGTWYGNAPGPDLGDVCTVARVAPGHDLRTGAPDWGLWFRAWRGPFAASCFRKVPARSTDVEIVARIKRSRPADAPKVDA